MVSTFSITDVSDDEGEDGDVESEDDPFADTELCAKVVDPKRVKNPINWNNGHQASTSSAALRFEGPQTRSRAKGQQTHFRDNARASLEGIP